MSDSSDDDRVLREKMKKEERKRKAKASKADGDGSKKLKKVEEKKEKTEDDMLSLGKNKFVRVNQFRGKLYVDFREYYEAETGLKPSKKGISLTVEQWSKLKSSIEEIDEMVRDQC